MQLLLQFSHNILQVHLCMSFAVTGLDAKIIFACLFTILCIDDNSNLSKIIYTNSGKVDHVLGDLDSEIVSACNG